MDLSKSDADEYIGITPERFCTDIEERLLLHDAMTVADKVLELNASLFVVHIPPSHFPVYIGLKN